MISLDRLRSFRCDKCPRRCLTVDTCWTAIRMRVPPYSLPSSAFAQDYRSPLIGWLRALAPTIAVASSYLQCIHQSALVALPLRRPIVHSSCRLIPTLLVRSLVPLQHWHIIITKTWKLGCFLRVFVGNGGNYRPEVRLRVPIWACNVQQLLTWVAQARAAYTHRRSTLSQTKSYLKYLTFVERIAVLDGSSFAPFWSGIDWRMCADDGDKSFFRRHAV
ncbi:hypothetical protein EDB85DRAFT_532643 [Lactarius pseudohatsudake]|nr:hypothetical protein EDB85DRAFT_532643 [Lactarius pseudohatsudake]